MALDITPYLPTTAEITEEQIQKVYARLRIQSLEMFPELKTTLNSVYGNLLLQPLATLLTIYEVAAERLQSDLVLENVANGVLYNCMSSNTEFITNHGVRSFKDFKHGDTVIVLTHTGAYKKAKVYYTGVQNLNTINIRRGKLTYQVKATAAHTWFLRDGTKTTDLKRGDMLLEGPQIFKPWNFFNGTVEEQIAWCYGYVFGDGTNVKAVDGTYKYSAVRLCGKEKDLHLEKFLNVGFSYSTPKSFDGDAVVYTGHYLKQPYLAEKESLEILQAFIRGYLDADGSKNYNKETSKKTSNDKEYIKIQAFGDDYISFILNTFPIVGQYITYQHDLTEQTTNFGKRRATTKEFGLNNYIYTHSAKFVVENIIPGEIEDTWCLDVEDDHSFVLPFGVATGNCDFVRSYLKNFGVSADLGVPVIGTVELVFKENKEYTINRGAQIVFGSNGLFHFIAPLPGDIHIYPVGATLDNLNSYSLTMNKNNRFIVRLPVVGAAGNVISAGTTATTDIPDIELVGLTSAFAFDTGRMPSDCPNLAKLAMAISYAANFADRGGAIGFLKRKLPNLIGVSPTKSGDDEMMRDKANILGVSDGKMDVCVKSELVADSCVVQVPQYSSFDYRGGLKLPGGIPVYITSITDLDGVPVDNYTLYGTSADNNRAILASSAFSNLEKLGLQVTSQTLPNTVATFDVIVNPLTNYPRLNTVASSGQYIGHLFSPIVYRYVKLTPKTIANVNGVMYGVFRAEDQYNHDTIENLYVGVGGVIDYTLSGVKASEFFNGLNLVFETSSGVFNVTSGGLFQGTTIELRYNAVTTSVVVNYLYDPAIAITDTLIKSPEVQPVVDVIAKAFNPCYITKLEIAYKRTSSTTVKKDQIKTELLTYFNSLSYENTLDTSIINDVLLYGGAKSMVSLNIEGKVYHSLASMWSTDGSDNISSMTVLSDKVFFESQKIYDEAGLYNIVGKRNIQYILETANITLTEVSV